MTVRKPTRSTKAEPFDIEVSARILRHIARGIYRSPAGAIKELISNAYDAGAANVTINTGYPVFDEISVSDDGKGMRKQEFAEIITSIGLSGKIVGQKFRVPQLKIQRKTIGHYGIGFLAVGQICSKLIIRSKVKGSVKGFRAELDFEQFEISKKTKKPLIKPEDEIEIKNKRKEKKRKIPIGKCTIRDEFYSSKDKLYSFTRLELVLIRPTILRKLTGKGVLELDKERAKEEKKYYSDFNSLLEKFIREESTYTEGRYPYDKLLWEMGMYCPVEYSDKLDVFNNGKLQFFQKLAKKNKFSVVIDGIKLIKPYPINFFDNKDHPVKKIFTWKKEKYTCNGQDYRIQGYLIIRKRIRPKCMQGVLIRQGGVAIGRYDLTYLSYPFHEGPKFEQITGEIYADGLAGALNIDRDSFNETDDNYLALASWLHEKLKDEVFKYLKKEQQLIRKIDVTKELKRSVNQFLRSRSSSVFVGLVTKGKNSPLFIKTGKKLSVNLDHPLGKVKKSNIEKMQLAVALIALRKISISEMESILEGMKNN